MNMSRGPGRGLAGRESGERWGGGCGAGTSPVRGVVVRVLVLILGLQLPFEPPLVVLTSSPP